MNKIKDIIRFMLLPQGFSERWQYIWGTISLNVISIAFSMLNGYLYILWLLIAIYSQLCLIQKRCRAIGKNATVFILSISLMMVASVWNQYNLLNGYVIGQSIVALIVILGLVAHIYLMCKKSITSADVNQTSKLMRHPIIITLVVWLITLVEMFFIALLQADLYEDERIYNLALAQGLIYRNTYGYEQVCAKHGYTMQNYPQAFMSQVQPEADYLKLALAPHGGQNLTPKQLPQDLADNINDELIKIRKIIATEQLALQNVQLPNQVKPDNNAIQEVTLSDACAFIDKVYVEHVEESQPVRMIKKIVADYRN